MAIDREAEASLVAQRDAQEEVLTCHACNAIIEGEPGGHGLFLWVRGDEVRYEEPALCDRCGVAIGIKALLTWAVEEEEG